MGIFKKKNKEGNSNLNKKSKNKNKDKNEEKVEDLLELDNNDSNVFLKNKKTFKDLIAVDALDFASDPKYGIMGDKYYFKNLYIGILPAMVNFATFLHNLYNFGNIDTSIFINPVDTETAKADLSKVKTNLEMEYLTAEGYNRMEDMAVKAQEAQRLRAEVRDGVNKIYETAIMSTLYEDDLRQLNNSTDMLKDILGQQDIGLKSAIYAQEDGFLSNKPFVNNRLGEWHTFDKRSLACVFPFTATTINHEFGVPIGFNMDNDLPVIYDNFAMELPNYNGCIFATAGGGKSTFIKMLSSRTSTFDKVQNVAIDIEPECIDICLTLGGINIDIEPHTKNILNFFDVVPDVEEDKFNKKKKEIIKLSAKINSVTDILMTMAKGNLENQEFVNDITRMIIKNTIKAEYERLEINSNPESLYKYTEEVFTENGLVGGKIKKEMPTMSSWYKQLEDQAKNNETETYKIYYDYLLMVMSDYCKYKNGSFDCFDGQSTVALSKDIPFINFNISKLNESGSEMGVAQHIICDFIWENLVKRNDDGHKIRVLIDEAWRMVGKGQEESLKFLITMFRRARKKNTATWVISQQFEEFYSEDTKPIIKNSATKLFLPPDETSVDDIQQVFKLTDGQTDFLRICKQGEGLLILGNNSVKLSIEIPPMEMQFVETNQNKKRYLKDQSIKIGG